MTVVDLNQWPRKEHFDFFSDLAFPFYSITTSLDVTRLYHVAKERKLSFYYAMVYATMAVINDITDFRYKIRGDQVVLHDKLHPSFVVLNKDTHLLKIVSLDIEGDLDAFCQAADARAKCQTSSFPSPESEARDDMVYISCTPWYSFTSLTNEMGSNPDNSIPHITWGKFEPKDGRLCLPLAVQLNHRLLDGYHVGLLVNGLQAYINHL